MTVKAWLYWVGRQTDNDYHVILGDTSELTSETVFMNAEASGLPPARPTQQPFVGLRRKLRQLIADNANKNGLSSHPSQCESPARFYGMGNIAIRTM